jgi:hypothetical protein
MALRSRTVGKEGGDPMSSVMIGGQPFDLGPFAAPRTSLAASEVLDDAMGLDSRREILRSVGLVPALTVVAGLFADLDLAVIGDHRSDVERSFIAGQVGALESDFQRHLAAGRTIFSNVGLVQCIKEIVEFADVGSEAEPSPLDLTRCVLGINEENDGRLDPELVARALNPQGHSVETLKADFLEIALDFVAQQLFDYSDPFETLACSVDETWRRGWAPGTKDSVIRDLGSGPADVFAEVMGAELDDFLALAWVFWNAARNDGQVGFTRDLLIATGLGENVIAAFTQQCSLSLGELRDRLTDERMSDVATPWMRYTLQEFPFLRFADGSVLMLRLQYAVQRMFGDLLYLKVHDGLKSIDPRRAKRFKNAMNTIFEHRVGVVLGRIADHESRFGGATIIGEDHMKAAWSNTRGEHRKICDYVYAQRNECILADANNRNLPRKFAERSAAGIDLRKEIQDMFAATKFEQLISTARQFISRGWTQGGATIAAQTKFLPFVIAPNAGMPSNMFTEFLILEQALPLIAEFDSRVLPPTIITWRDLQILEGIAEQAKGGRIIELLIMWRLSNYSKATQMSGLPLSLSDFVDHHFTLGLPMSSHERTVGAALFETIREHAVRRYLESEPSRQFGQLPHLDLSDTFDAPLPDDELDAWEGNPHP